MKFIPDGTVPNFKPKKSVQEEQDAEHAQTQKKIIFKEIDEMNLVQKFHLRSAERFTKENTEKVAQKDREVLCAMVSEKEKLVQRSSVSGTNLEALRTIANTESLAADLHNCLQLARGAEIAKRDAERARLEAEMMKLRAEKQAEKLGILKTQESFLRQFPVLFQKNIKNL